MHLYILLSRGVAEGYVTMVAEDIRGAYPSSRCGISIYTCICNITTDVSKLSVLVDFLVLVENL